MMDWHYRTFIISRHKGALEWMKRELGATVVARSTVLSKFRIEERTLKYFRAGDVIHTTPIPRDYQYRLEAKGVDVYIMLHKRNREKDARFFNHLPYEEIKTRNPRWHKD